MCCNRDNYYSSRLILLFIFKIIIGSISILHRPKRKMRQNYYKKYNNYVIYLFYQCK